MSVLTRINNGAGVYPREVQMNVHEFLSNFDSSWSVEQARIPTLNEWMDVQVGYYGHSVTAEDRKIRRLVVLFETGEVREYPQSWLENPAEDDVFTVSQEGKFAVVKVQIEARIIAFAVHTFKDVATWTGCCGPDESDDTKEVYVVRREG